MRCDDVMSRGICVMIDINGGHFGSTILDFWISKTVGKNQGKVIKTTPFHFRMQMQSLHSSFSILNFISLFPPETRRPPWLDPDPSPADLEHARKALLYEHNPNQPHSPDRLRAERLGLNSRPLHRRSHTAPAHMRTEKVSVPKVSENNNRFFGTFSMPTFGLRAFNIIVC